MNFVIDSLFLWWHPRNRRKCCFFATFFVGSPHLICKHISVRLHFFWYCYEIMKSSFICIEIQSNAVTPHDNEPKQIRPSIGLRYRSIEFCFILFLSLFSLIEISMEFPNWQSTGWWLSLLLSLYLFLSVSVSLVLSSSYIPQKCHTLFCAHNHFSCISRVIQGQIYPRIVNSTNLDLGLTLSLTPSTKQWPKVYDIMCTRT